MGFFGGNSRELGRKKLELGSMFFFQNLGRQHIEVSSLWISCKFKHGDKSCSVAGRMCQFVCR